VAKLEHQTKDGKAQEAVVKDLQGKLAALEKAGKEAAEKLAHEQKKHGELIVQQKDTQEENDLLLAQLHQVQEELERYFLKAQDLEQARETEQLRWQRLANRYSGLCDYKDVQWLAEQSDEKRHVWQIKDYIDASGRMLETLRFEVLTREGFVGFGFKRNDAVLSFWPLALGGVGRVGGANGAGTGQSDTGSAHSTESSERFEVIAGRSPEALIAFAGALDALSAADWSFLNTLVDLMIEQYQSMVDGGQEEVENWIETDIAVISATDKSHASAIDNPSQWLAGLEQFSAILQNIPLALRFDEVKVVSCTQEGDYAHMVLSLSNLVTERGSYPAFEFRVATVSAAGVFDANPRLEFPRRTGEDVFERWFVESTNAFGENLEVRFAKQDSLVDLPLITAKLKEADAKLVAQVVERLPSIITKVRDFVASGGKAQTYGFDNDDVSSDGISGASNPKTASVLLSPSVGRLSVDELAKWEQVAATMRGIWQTQVRV
jgi:hypothetical protein